MLQGPQITGTPGIATAGLFHHVLHACCMSDIRPSVRLSAAFTPTKQHLASCQHRVCIRKKPRRTKLPERLFTEALALREAKFKLSHDVRLLVQFCKTQHWPEAAGPGGGSRSGKVWLSSC